MCLNSPSPTIKNHQAMSTSYHGIVKRPKKNLCPKPISSVVTRKPNITVKDLLDGDLVKKSSPPQEVKIQNNDPPNVRLGTKAFIQILLHSRNCR